MTSNRGLRIHIKNSLLELYAIPFTDETFFMPLPHMTIVLVNSKEAFMAEFANRVYTSFHFFWGYLLHISMVHRGQMDWEDVRWIECMFMRENLFVPNTQVTGD